MRWSSLISSTTTLVVAILTTAGTAGAAQERDTGGSAQPATRLADSLRSLEAQVHELSAALEAIRSEAAQSQAEARELRRELRETREQLEAFQLQLELRRASSMLLAPGPSPAGNATPPASSASEGQVDERLARLEENQQLLSAEMNDQYQMKVESGSKYRVRLSGIGLLNAFTNRGSVDNLDVPSLAQPHGALDSNGTFGATVRQSQLSLEVFGPSVAGARTSGQLQFDFFGGFPDAENGVTAGLIRLRTATARFDWSRTSIVAGQDRPFFSPLSPTSLASLAFPAFSYSGNLWTWTPQVRVERRWDLSEDSSFLIQGGVLDPLTGEVPPTQFDRSPHAGERAGQPAYATRLSWTRSVFGAPLTIGAGGYYARQDWGFGRTVDAWAGTADWSLPLGRQFSITGEFYRGRAIGGLGAAEGRSVLFSGPLTDPGTSVAGLNTVGGWSQVKFKPTEKLEFNGAFGQDYPSPYDLRRFSQNQSFLYSSVGRNQSAFVNSIYHARSNLLFSLEYRRLWTSQAYESRLIANHVNLGVGVLF